MHLTLFIEPESVSFWTPCKSSSSQFYSVRFLHNKYDFQIGPDGQIILDDDDDDGTEGMKKEEKNEEDKDGKKGKKKEEEKEDLMPVPQVTIGADGQIVLNEER